jgi:hypothetical protein
MWNRDGAKMDSETRYVLNSIFVYATILDNTNLKLQELIRNSKTVEMLENAQVFYEICSEVMRVFPVYTPKGNPDCLKLDTRSGILLLKERIGFLEDEFAMVFDKENYKKIFDAIHHTRNKFIHEPHNIRAVSFVGGADSCVIGLSYKESTRMISTVEITHVIIDINMLFTKIKNWYIETVSKYDEEYQDYPCYKNMLAFDFAKHNEKYPTLPLGYWDDEDEIDYTKEDM